MIPLKVCPIKRCKICAYYIPDAAKKCNHCGSFQSRFRESLNLTNILVTLVIASIGALALVISPIAKTYRAYKDLNSEIEIKFIDITPAGVNFLFMNSGGKPGLIFSGDLKILKASYSSRSGSEIVKKNIKEDEICKMGLLVESSPLVLKPDEFKVAVLGIDKCMCTPNDDSEIEKIRQYGTYGQIEWKLDYSNFQTTSIKEPALKKESNFSVKNLKTLLCKE